MDAAADRHLWAEGYDRDLGDILALQSDVARSIAREVNVVLTPQEQWRLARSRPVDPEAQASYLDRARALAVLDRLRVRRGSATSPRGRRP